MPYIVGTKQYHRSYNFILPFLHPADQYPFLSFSPPPEERGKKGKIIGGVVGGLAGLILVVLFLIWMNRGTDYPGPQGPQPPGGQGPPGNQPAGHAPPGMNPAGGNARGMRGFFGRGG